MALLNGGRRALGLCLFVILQLSAPVDWAFSASLALAGLVSQLVMKKWVPLEAAKDTKTTIELLRRALPFALTGVSGQFRNADVPIVTMALGGTAAAAYGLGSRLASPFLLVFSSASSLILVRARSFTRRQVRMLLILLLTGTALLAISLVSASHLLVSPLSNVIPWLTQEETSIIALVASGYLFAGSAIVLGSLCVAFGLQLALVTINVTTTIASLTLVAILSHVTAAGLPPAIASSCCYGLQAFILTLLLFTRRKEGSV
ncbi:hypothetical protein [Leucobacter massiliensis]|uniref:hypothetical protein n=1 Tax=Leucobacter massiliensis TaxID=1686285 RepID=UPI0015E3456A|nr:hypothetical protein [Leucobacter massiliensis]